MQRPAVEEFVTDPQHDRFEELALDCFAYQYHRIEALRDWCDRGRRTPASVTRWSDIPAVPTRAFRSLALHTEPARIVFRSSGTTGGLERSEHHHPFPDLYRLVIERSFPTFCLAEHPQLPMLSLIPPLAQVPDSSLSFMIDHVLGRFGTEASVVAVGPGGVELPRVRSWLGARQRAGGPCLVLATSVSLHQCLQGLERLGLRFRLPPGSAVFETGGTKTLSDEIDPALLHRRLAERLGVGPGRIVTEYGMTELTSQAYGGALVGADPRRLLCPPWMRVRIVDPESLEEVSAGELGLVAVLDLANVGSAVHVLTEDLGRRDGAGFRLEGRARGAALRGCSLTADELARRDR
ncbi:MAG: long-chain fatty acid--CoA ligase [Thermoanaerobaculia bacterium]|nr:long-chain fatty acid--CoA ligase [Thermoanaerobaculia bacterium]